MVLAGAICIAAADASAPRGFFRTRLFVDYEKHRWTDAQLVTLQERFPGAWTSFQYTQIPPGSPVWLALGDVIDELQAKVPGARVCISFRPDLKYKFREDASGSTWVGGTMHRYCPATKPNVCSTWESNVKTCVGGAKAGRRCLVKSDCPASSCGHADEIFDTDWIMRVPRTEWDAMIDARWDGDDPFDAGTSHKWNSQVDRAAVTALATPTSVPALYGTRNRAGKMTVNQLVLDLRHEGARAWKVKEALAILQDARITGSETGCLFLGYKPGWYARYEGSARFDACRTSNDRTFAGYMWGAAPPRGCKELGPMPLQDTQYAPGEFEAAIDDFTSRLDAALTAADLSGVKIVVQEAPPRERRWVAIPRLVESSRFLGEVEPVTKSPLR